MIESRDRNRVQRWRRRPETWWWISGFVVVPVLAMTGIAVVVLLVTTHPTSPADRIDVVKTALSVGAGTGGVVALVLTWRRQWHVEKAQQATEHDATERRITELYGKAVEQLGADKAPVRLGGLYSLERLAQDNPPRRQHIVNVLCAYLRMPYDPPDTSLAVDAPPDVRDDHRERVAEREVRLATQDILAQHLRPRNPSTFWPDIDLNLVGAHLIDLDMNSCRISDVRFNDAKFTGDASFFNTEFTYYAWFSGAEFTGDAEFGIAEFPRIADFENTEFAGNAEFGGAKFTGSNNFMNARFIRAPSFLYTQLAYRDYEEDDYFWVCLEYGYPPELFPEGWSLEPTDDRPEGVTTGSWGVVTTAPSPWEDPDPEEEQK